MIKELFRIIQILIKILRGLVSCLLCCVGGNLRGLFKMSCFPRIQVVCQEFKILTFYMSSTCNADFFCLCLMTYIRSLILLCLMSVRRNPKLFILQSNIVSRKVFSMPILVIRGHQIVVDGTAMDVVRTVSRPVARCALIGSIYMTIVIAFERYCGKHL